MTDDFAFILVAALVGCAPGSDGSADAGCQSTADCPTGRACSSGHCRLPGGEGASCETSTDCVAGDGCIANHCQPGDIACHPGDRRCNGDAVEQCRADQSDREKVTACASGCLNAECQVPSCTPNDFRCQRDDVPSSTPALALTVELSDRAGAYDAFTDVVAQLLAGTNQALWQIETRTTARCSSRASHR